MQPKFPLFVRAKDSGEISNFSSAHELQAHVERIDIENDEYEAWDADGFRVDLGIQDPVWLNLRIAEEHPDLNQLGRSLRHYAQAVGVQLPDNLKPDEFQSVVAQVRAEQEKQSLDGSVVRRFVARFKHR